MNYLVDTHILLWSFFEPVRLSVNTQTILLNTSNAIYYSPVSLWEISIKYGLKKIQLNGSSPEEFFQELISSFYLCKEIEGIKMITNYNLPFHHKDPFDRYIIWEAIQSNLVLISADGMIDRYKNSNLKIVCN